MKVKDIIEALKESDSEMEVCILVGDNCSYELDIYEQHDKALGWVLVIEDCNNAGSGQESAK